MAGLPLYLLIILIVAAVAAGLWVGGRAGQEVEGSRGKGAKPIGTRVRDAAGRGVVKLWKWNRSRKRAQKQRERDDKA